MAFFPFNRKPEKRLSKTSSNFEATDGRSHLTLQLEAVNRQRREILQKAEETRRTVEDIPKQIAERKRREVERIHERAQNHKTVRGLGEPPYRISSVVANRKMTRGQHRSMATKFLILCPVVAVLLLILWRAVP
jgi:hypothetical protein